VSLHLYGSEYLLSGNSPGKSKLPFVGKWIVLYLLISEPGVEEADSRNKRTKRMEQLERACMEKVKKRFAPELERIAEESLGKPKNGPRWMEFQIDDDTHWPVLFSLSIQRSYRYRITV
jgi:hypothetical protein